MHHLLYRLSRVIYPHSYTQFLESKRTEKELMEILEAAHLAYVPSREGGWFARKEWRDVLSGGEKQRVGLIITCYHLLFSTLSADELSACILSQTKVRSARR